MRVWVVTAYTDYYGDDYPRIAGVYSSVRKAANAASKLGADHCDTVELELK